MQFKHKTLLPHFSAGGETDVNHTNFSMIFLIIILNIKKVEGIYMRKKITALIFVLILLVCSISLVNANQMAPDLDKYSTIIELNSIPLSVVLKHADKYGIKITAIQIAYYLDGQENRICYQVGNTTENKDIIKAFKKKYNETIALDDTVSLKQKDKYMEIANNLQKNDIDIKNITILGNNEDINKFTTAITSSIIRSYDRESLKVQYKSKNVEFKSTIFKINNAKQQLKAKKKAVTDEPFEEEDEEHLQTNNNNKDDQTEIITEENVENVIDDQIETITGENGGNVIDEPTELAKDETLVNDSLEAVNEE